MAQMQPSTRSRKIRAIGRAWTALALGISVLKTLLFDVPKIVTKLQSFEEVFRQLPQLALKVIDFSGLAAMFISMMFGPDLLREWVHLADNDSGERLKWVYRAILCPVIGTAFCLAVVYSSTLAFLFKIMGWSTLVGVLGILAVVGIRDALERP